MKRSRMKNTKKSRVKRKTNKHTVYNKKLYGGSNVPLLYNEPPGESYRNPLFVDEGELSDEEVLS